ncbi:SGNH/GDSL hydrolase family protein [Streptomyces sp. NBC_01498]|uniref:SGNH/GDSL hydrolase family protein n=1 Tax=Streptomyces sp. NBC_01498 TaxID=2975870 RepID=UPI002E7B79DA|nr:SGNH/GDSL hydrolase family protein [Streptomyces sp. NBC_01498]WTL26702.1 SGNH/GDSL hydrolase family protein [Streptomyces sp. NBC_01498]
MSGQRGFALLAGLVTVVALVCATIFAGVGALGGGGGRDLGGGSGDRATAAGSGAGDGARDGAGTGTARGSGAGSDSGGEAGSGSGGGRARTPVGSAAPVSADAWVGTWAAAPAGIEPGAPHGHAGRSLRNVVHTSIGGTAARITLSNLFSRRALLIGRASLAVSAGNGSAGAAPGTLRVVTFGKKRSVIVPPGGRVVSDAVRLRVPPDTDLLVTVHTPLPGGPVTYHPRALRTSYTARGDRTLDGGGAPYTGRVPVWRYLTAVDVLNRRARGSVVVIGDSITDGVGSSYDADRRWTDTLADRVRDSGLGVLNAGISGNRVLRRNLAAGKGPSGVDRFGRDVLGQSGAEVVFVALGINDIIGRPHETDPERIVAGLRSLTRQGRARGLRVVGSTLMPFGGSPRHSDAGEAVRDRVNEAIRAGRVFDRTVDFDRLLRDPYAPDRLRPDYDSGDGLHPSDAAYRAMGRFVDLGDLVGREPARL